MSVGPALAAVAGIGCVCGTGTSLNLTLDGLEAHPPRPAPPRRLPEISSTHPVFEVTLPGAPETGLFAEHGLAMLWRSVLQALRQAGLSPEDMAGKRVGVCIGSSVGFATDCFPLYRAWKQGHKPPPEGLSNFQRSNYALALHERLRLTGPCQLVANACASGTDAIGIGAQWIASGACDMVLAGGAEALSLVSYAGFIRLMITSNSPCRPFDRARDGLNLGEGAAVLLLCADAASSRTAGRILGYGAASDAYHLTAPHPEGRGLKKAFATALGQANLSPRDMAFVCVHGTGTPENDKVEGKVLRELFPGTAFLATKGATGHALGSAGAVEAAITLGFLNRGRIPASPGFREPDPQIGVCPTERPKRLTGRVAASDSLAFGGCNAVLILEGARA